MFKKTTLIFILIIVILLFNNCQYFTLMNYKEWQETSINAESNVDIYVGGYYKNGSYYFPCYWKNGKLVNLPYENTPSVLNNFVNSIFVEENNVYCGGCYYNTSGIINACYWKNGELQKVEVDSTASISCIYSIKVIGGVVYSVGHEYIGTDPCPRYWINGKKYSLKMPPGVTGYVYPKAIDIDKDTLDFYITGYYGGSLSCYWVNGGAPVLIALKSASSANLINGKLYIGGNYNNTPSYWLEGKIFELQDLSSGSSSALSAWGITIYDGTVYTAGVNRGGYSCSYKDQTCLWTSSDAGYSYMGITVYNNDIYIAGTYQAAMNYASCWKNGSLTNLPIPGNDGYATSIFVKEKSR